MQAINLLGNVTKEATFNKVSEKQDAVNFTIAVNRQQLNRETGQYEDLDPFFWQCVRYVPTGKGAEIAAKITAGRHFSVEGRIQTGKPRAGTSREHGEVLFVNKTIVVDSMQPTGSAKPKAA